MSSTMPAPTPRSWSTRAPVATSAPSTATLMVPLAVVSASMLPRAHAGSCTRRGRGRGPERVSGCQRAAERGAGGGNPPGRARARRWRPSAQLGPQETGPSPRRRSARPPQSQCARPSPRQTAPEPRALQPRPRTRRTGTAATGTWSAGWGIRGHRRTAAGALWGRGRTVAAKTESSTLPQAGRACRA